VLNLVKKLGVELFYAVIVWALFRRETQAASKGAGPGVKSGCETKISTAVRWQRERKGTKVDSELQESWTNASGSRGAGPENLCW